MANIENLKAFDPFADAAKGNDEGVQDGLVHIRSGHDVGGHVPWSPLNKDMVGFRFYWSHFRCAALCS